MSIENNWYEEYYNGWHDCDTYDDDEYCHEFGFFESNGLTISEIKKDPFMWFLRSKHILIGDIDCGENIDAHLRNIHDYAKENQETFAIYKTKNGLRFFQTNILYQSLGRSSINLLNKLNCDPLYIEKISELGYFAARLTPKLKTFNDYYELIMAGGVPKVRVCKFLGYTTERPRLIKRDNPNFNYDIDLVLGCHDNITLAGNSHLLLPLA